MIISLSLLLLLLHTYVWHLQKMYTASHTLWFWIIVIYSCHFPAPCGTIELLIIEHFTYLIVDTFTLTFILLKMAHFLIHVALLWDYTPTLPLSLVASSNPSPTFTPPSPLSSSYVRSCFYCGRIDFFSLHYTLWRSPVRNQSPSHLAFTSLGASNLEELWALPDSHLLSFSPLSRENALLFSAYDRKEGEGRKVCVGGGGGRGSLYFFYKS